MITELENEENFDVADPDTMDNLEWLHKTYGRREIVDGKIKKIAHHEPEGSSSSFDDKFTILTITQQRLGLSFFKIAGMIKRRVSFYTIYQHEDEIEMLKARHDLMQKQLQNVIKDLLKRTEFLEQKAGVGKKGWFSKGKNDSDVTLSKIEVIVEKPTPEPDLDQQKELLKKELAANQVDKKPWYMRKAK